MTGHNKSKSKLDGELLKNLSSLDLSSSNSETVPLAQNNIPSPTPPDFTPPGGGTPPGNGMPPGGGGGRPGGNFAVDDFNAITEDASGTTQEVATGNLILGDVTGQGADTDPNPNNSRDLVISPTFVGTFVGQYGTLTINADGSYSYVLDNASIQSLGDGVQVQEQFAYEVQESPGVSDNAVLTIVITGTNDAPVAQAGTAAAVEDGPSVPGQLVASDVDVNDVLSYSLIEGPTEGSVSIDAVTGAYAFDPGVDFQDLGVGETRDVSFTYEVSDGQGGVAQNVVTVTVTGTNDAPVVNPVFLGSTPEDNTFIFTAEQLLANSSDVDGDDLSVVSVQLVDLAAGVLFDREDGSWSFIPNANFNGSGIRLSFEVSDGTVSVSGGATLDVTAVNDAPVLTQPDPAEERLVNSFTTHNQNDSSITALADGGWVVTWTSTGQDGSGLGVYAQRYDAQGNRAGEELQLHQVTANTQSSSSVAALPDGGFVVAWQSLGQDGLGTGIITRRFDADNNAVGDETLVNSFAAGNQDQPHITALENGGWIVVWRSADQDGSGAGVFGQLFDINGAPSGGEFLVNTETAGDQSTPVVASLSGGGFIVSWTSAGQDGNGDGVYAQRYDEQGVAVGSEFRVNTEVVNDQELPVITASLEGGGFVIAWQSLLQDGSSFGVYAQVYDANGQAVGAETLVNTRTSGNELTPSITALSGGGFAVVWRSDSQDGSGSGVYGQIFDAAGARIGGEFQVNTFTQGSQDEPQVTGLPDGGFVVSWTSVAQDGDRDGVFQRVFNADGSVREFSADVTYVENAVAVEITGDIRVADVDSATLQGASVRIADYVAGEDRLVFTNSGEITGTWDEVTGILTLSGEASLEDYQSALRSVAYENLSDNPTGTMRTIEFQVTDGGLENDASNIVSNSVTIVPVNDAPVALSGEADAVEDGPAVSDPLEASDVDGDTLTYSLVQGPTEGSVVINADGGYSFDPGADFQDLGVGETRDVSFTYEVSDGEGGVAQNVVTITVTGTNDAPVVGEVDLGSVVEDGTRTITAAELLSGSDDVDGDALSVAGVSLADPSVGTLVDNGDGTWTFTPTADFNGEDVTLSYGVFDGTVTVSGSAVIDVTAVNDAPVAPNLTRTTNEDTSISGSLGASDVDGDSLTYSLISGPDAGSVSINSSTGAYSFNPGSAFQNLAAGQSTNVSFTYRANDGRGGTDDGTVTVTVTGLNDAATISSIGTQSVSEDNGTHRVNFTVNDPDLPNGNLVVTASSSNGGLIPNDSNLSGGGLVVGGSGSNRYIDYQTAPNAFGSGTITVNVFDGVTTTQRTFTVNVAEVNDAPVAPNQSRTTNEDTSISGSLGASDVDGDSLTYSLISGPVAGSVSINSSTGAYSFNPGSAFQYLAAGQSTNVSFVYRANDGRGGTDDGTVTVTVTGLNDAATISSIGTQSVSEDSGTHRVNFTVNDPDLPNGNLVVTASSSNGGLIPNDSNLSGGGLVVGGSGSNRYIDYQTAPNAFGSGTITVNVFDGVTTTQRTFTVNVAEVNDAPVAPNRTATTNEDSSVSGSLAASDVDGDSLTYSLVSGPSGGSVSINASTGAYTFNPGSAFQGLDTNESQNVSFTYRANDGRGGTDDGTVTVTVTGVNDAPVISGSNFSTTIAENVPPGTLLLDIDATDVDGEALTYSIVDASSVPQVTIDANTGVISVANGFDFEQQSQVNFQVRVSDGTTSDTENVTINVEDVEDRVEIAATGFTPFSAELGFEWRNIITTTDSGLQDVETTTADLYYTVTETLVGTLLAVFNPLSGDSVTFTPLVEGVEVELDDQTGFTLIYANESFQFPVIFDLDGDGVELVSPFESSTTFDQDGDGVRDQTGWVGADDALLVLDRNGNGVIDDGSEISFVNDLPGATTDLEGLAAYDTNRDGVFDAGDAGFDRFQIWQDVNQDGISQADELRTLDQAGIASIDLALNPTGQTLENTLDNVIFNTTIFTRSDGTTGEVGDVALRYVSGAESSDAVLGGEDINAALIQMTAAMATFDTSGTGGEGGFIEEDKNTTLGTLAASY